MKTIIDNISQIRDLLKFDESGDVFYFLQIMQRKKDSTGITHNSRIINNYYITSIDFFDSRIDEIKDLCNKFNARAYINLNPCSFSKCCIFALKEIADMMMENHQRGLINLMPTLAGKYPIGGDNKVWLIDYDSKDEKGIDFISDFIRNQHGKIAKQGENKVITKIPTKNGFHILCYPFDPREFNKTMSDSGIPAEIHKNNPTILYMSYDQPFPKEIDLTNRNRYNQKVKLIGNPEEPSVYELEHTSLFVRTISDKSGDKENIKAYDLEGGPMLSVGDEIEGFEIESIKRENNKTLFTLKNKD